MPFHYLAPAKELSILLSIAAIYIRIWCYSRLGRVGIVQWRATVDKGVRYHSSAFRRCLHLGRANEHISQQVRPCAFAEGWVREAVFESACSPVTRLC
jgi:hypothetical protein